MNSGTEPINTDQFHNTSAIQNYLNYLLRYKYRVALTYFATLVGSLLIFLYPYVTGIAIDGALNRNPKAILPLAIIWMVHLFVEAFRQIFDTRTFTVIFAEAASDMISTQKSRGHSTSEIAARVNMMEDLTWFMGSSLPELIISLVTPIGSFFVLLVLSYPIALGALSISLLALLLNFMLFSRIKARQIIINSLHEKSVEKIDGGKNVEIQNHYRALGKAFVRVRDINAVSWGGVQILGVAFIAFGIWTTGGIASITTGEAYSTVAYIWRVLEGVFAIPSYAHQFARLSDIWRRVSSAPA